jgi:hypothetical protein
MDWPLVAVDLTGYSVHSGLVVDPGVEIETGRSFFKMLERKRNFSLKDIEFLSRLPGHLDTPWLKITKIRIINHLAVAHRRAFKPKKIPNH